MAEKLFKSQQEALEALSKTLDEIQSLLPKEKQDALKKSGDMAKAEVDEENPEAVEAAPEATPAPEAAPESNDAIADQAQAEVAPEAAEHDEAAEPPAEAMQDEGEKEMSAHAASLTDEELEMMLSVLMSEHEKRHASEAPAEEGAAAPAPEAAAPEAAPAMGKSSDLAKDEEGLEKGIKKEFSKLNKSFQEATDTINGLKKDIEELKRAPKTKTVSKAAAANREGITVLEKSQKPIERLTKSATADYLLAQQRLGNKAVGSEIIARVMATRNDEELFQTQDEIVRSGVKFPGQN